MTRACGSHRKGRQGGDRPEHCLLGAPSRLSAKNGFVKHASEALGKKAREPHVPDHHNGLLKAATLFAESHWYPLGNHGHVGPSCNGRCNSRWAQDQCLSRGFWTLMAKIRFAESFPMFIVGFPLALGKDLNFFAFSLWNIFYQSHTLQSTTSYDLNILPICWLYLVTFYLLFVFWSNSKLNWKMIEKVETNEWKNDIHVFKSNVRLYPSNKSTFWTKHENDHVSKSE